MAALSPSWSGHGHRRAYCPRLAIAPTNSRVLNSASFCHLPPGSCPSRAGPSKGLVDRVSLNLPTYRTSSLAVWCLEMDTVYFIARASSLANLNSLKLRILLYLFFRVLSPFFDDICFLHTLIRFFTMWTYREHSVNIAVFIFSQQILPFLSFSTHFSYHVLPRQASLILQPQNTFTFQYSKYLFLHLLFSKQ